MQQITVKTNDPKRVATAFIERSSERQLELFNREAIQILGNIVNNYPAYSDVVRLSDVQAAEVLYRRPQRELLVRAPFCLFEPLLPDVRSWESLVNSWATESVATIRSQITGTVDGELTFKVRHLNMLYLNIARDYAANYIMAPVVLNMSHELLAYIVSLDMRQEIALLNNLGAMPLFRWRPGEKFWFDFMADAVTSELLAHYLMQSSPEEIRIGNLARTSDWDARQYKRDGVNTLLNAMLAYGLRASTASKILGRTAAEVRNRFVQIHDKSSTCGSAPRSLTWVTSNSKNRVHATFFTWLYRNASVGADRAYFPFLASLNIYEKMFTEEDRTATNLTVDRAYHMIQLMSHDAGLGVGGCKKCDTHYLLANSSERIEIAEFFACPVCTGRMATRNKPAKKAA